MAVSLLEYSWLAIDVYDAPPKTPKKPQQAVSLTPAQVTEKLDQCLTSIKQQQMNGACDTLASHVVQQQKQSLFSNAMAHYQASVAKPTTLSRQQLYAHGWIILYDYKIKEADGFFARLYGNLYTGDTVIAYRGTVLTEIENLGANYHLWHTKSSGMLTKAAKFYYKAVGFIIDYNGGDKKLRTFSAKISLTGHSLGGYLAQYVSLPPISAKSLAVVFNAPKIGGLHDPIVGYVDPSQPYPNVLNIDIDYDYVHRIGKLIGQQYILHGDEQCSPQALMLLASLTHEINAIARQSYCVYKEHGATTVSANLEALPEQTIAEIPVRP